MILFSKKEKNLPRRRRDLPRSVEDERKKNFQCNRILTGSTSSSVRSANEFNAQLKSARTESHELVRRRRHIGGLFFLVLTGGLLLLGLIWQFTANVEIRTSNTDITSIYEESLNGYFALRPIERIRIFINKNNLNDYMKKIAPEIKTIQANGAIGFGKSLFIADMREPIASWSINDKKQYVDATGTVFEKNYYRSPSIKIVDKSGIRTETGKTITSNRFLESVGRIVGFTEMSGRKVSKVIIPPGKTREVQLEIKNVKYPIKLSVYRSAGEQVEDMIRAINWLKKNNKTPKYLDVKVSGRAFYK